MVYKLLNPALRKVARVYKIVLLTVFTATTINQPSYANNIKFFCEQSKGIPTTFARREDGRKIPIIRWVSSYSFLTPLQRCQEVSRRFQRSYDNGTLKTITTGMINEHSVICAVVSTNDACTNPNVLFTLKPGDNGKVVLERLLDRRSLAGSMIQNQSSDDSQIYIDFETYLNYLQPEG